MFEELDVIELTHAIRKHNLQEGEAGTIVVVYQNGAAYEVEFVEPDGGTKALLTLMPEDIRPWREENNHVSHTDSTIYFPQANVR